ncbi:DUF6077 domain-containing protein [Faecalicoccus pleomorphus]|uniref:DUF6077 domain-containing protein n=1 Tax=Faecalicoccus pleomorphus TaxID=1323 RepID=UPI0022E4E74A|nr:DUF6077 domain-containing protein [Faecalicoccus pleomorphus]
MYGYLIGTVLTLLSAIVFQLFGICICKNKKSFSYSFVIGYLVYSFLVAIAGIPIQILNLPWMTFFWYMIFLIIAIVFYILYSFKKKYVVLHKNIILNYIKENWFLYLGSILLLGFALTHISIIWFNNMSDDAYYLTKMATLPYLENPFRIDYSTGFIDTNLNSYLFNTFELEASFYIFVTKIDPSLYARGFLALLNYFILLNAIKAFFEILFKKIKINILTSKLQFYVVTLFVLFVLSSTLYITTDAQWTIISAAYYGSALERIGCIFFVLVPLMDVWQLDTKKIIITFITCVVMISKSTIAIPLLFMLTIGYLTVEWIRRKKYLLFFILVFLLFALGVLLPTIQSTFDSMIHNVILNISNPLIIISFAIFALLGYKYEEIRNLLTIIIISFLLMVVPVINNVTLTTMQYYFVATRTIYSLLVFVLIVTYGLIYIFLIKLIDKRRFTCVILNTALVLSIFIASGFFGYEWSDPIKAAHTYLTNINIIPDSTILLGETLEEYYHSTGRVLNMVMTPGVHVNGLGHFSSQIVRVYSPHTLSITAGLRLSEEIKNDKSEFDGFSVADVEQFNLFFVNPTIETLSNIEELCQKYPIDCIVGNDVNDINTSLLEKIGFYKYDIVTDPQAEPAISYTIYIKAVQ